MISTDNLVEIPLDPQYITPEGMYIAGYIWGRHIRSPKHPPKGATPDFIKGIEDGYGDGMERNIEGLEAYLKHHENEKS